MTYEHIAVIGAGAWGTALANVIARTGRSVMLAARDRASAEAIATRRESPRLLGVTLDMRVGVAPAGIEAGRYDAILLAVPSQQLRDAAAHDRARAQSRIRRSSPAPRASSAAATGS